MNTDTKYGIVGLMVAVVASSGLVFGSAHYSAPKRGMLPIQSRSLPTGSTVRDRLLGKAYAQLTRYPYVLIEWGDYECPPCRAQHKALSEILAGKQGRIGFAFRNLPLTSIHPDAYQAALYAEAARDQLKFDQMHNFIYESDDISPKRLADYVQTAGFNKAQFQHSLQTTARNRVENDLKAAQSFGIDSTPTLILCSSDGTNRTVDLSEIEKILQ